MLVYQGKVLHVFFELRKRQGAGALQHAGFSPGGGISWEFGWERPDIADKKIPNTA